MKTPSADTAARLFSRIGFANPYIRPGHVRPAYLISDQSICVIHSFRPLDGGWAPDGRPDGCCDSTVDGPTRTVAVRQPAEHSSARQQADDPERCAGPWTAAPSYVRQPDERCEACFDIGDIAATKQALETARSPSAAATHGRTSHRAGDDRRQRLSRQPRHRDQGSHDGRDTVVGIGSLVSRSLPAGVIAAGTPPRVIRELDSD